MATVRSVLRNLGSRLIALSERGSPVPSAYSDSSKARFEDQAYRIIRAHKGARVELIGGCLQLLGLSEIKREIGSGPGSLANVVHIVATEVIARHLAKEDAFHRYDEETYILCFATCDKHDAESRTKLIAAEIRNRLKGEAPEAAVRVGQTVAKIDCSPSQVGNGLVIDGIAASLKRIREEAANAVATWRQRVFENATIHFSPVWSPRRQVISIYRTRLASETGRQALRQLCILSEVDDLRTVLLDLDCLVLGRATQALHALLNQNGASQILVPVNLTALDCGSHEEKYFGLCAEIPDPYRKLLLFELHSPPSGTTMTRIISIACRLKQHAYGVVVEVRPATASFQELGNAALHGISIDANLLPRTSLEARWCLLSLTSMAKECGLSVFVHGADTVYMAEAAINSPVDWVDGRGLAPAVSEPRSASRWTPSLSVLRSGTAH